ncbi:MAG: hypothetical protein WD772_09925 [Pseudohongiellaceae bacterium]
MHSTFLQLDPFELVKVQGPDARKFLQGQVSCNLDDLSPSQSLSGALCNLKGRVISDFRLMQLGDDCYLQLESGLGSVVKAVLDKYIVFSKAKTSLVSSRFARYGLLGNDAHRLLTEIFASSPVVDGRVVQERNISIIKIAGLVPRYEIWVDLDSASSSDSDVIATIRLSSLSATGADWTREDMRAGIVHIEAGMTEIYLPQQLNYDLSGLINFKKGCYTGQEIVARMYYRSMARKRLYYLLAGNIDCVPEKYICHLENGSEQRNEVLKMLKDSEGNCHVLAILPVEAVESKNGFYFPGRQQEVALMSQPLPYLP